MDSREAGHSSAMPLAAPRVDATDRDDGAVLRAVAPDAAQPDFDTLYATHFDAVSRCLLALGIAPSNLDDATQDVFVVVYRRLGDFEGRSSARTWILAIAIRVAHDYRRQVRRKGSALEPLNDELMDKRPAPDEQAARAETMARVSRALATLDDPKRTVFVLAEIEGLTAPEIAEVVGAPVATVYSRLRLARADFEREFGRLERSHR